MATVTISNLYLTGSLLFSDEETFLNELSDEQTSLVYGGFKCPKTALCVPITRLSIVWDTINHRSPEPRVPLV